MSELVDRAKASLEGVTDGPWVSWKSRESCESYSDGYVYRGNVISDSTKQIVVTKSGNAANSLFIAAARQLVPELIEYAEKVIQERDEALRVLEAERESHQETAEIMRRTRERAERLEKRSVPESVTRIDMIDPKRHEHWSDYWSVSIQDEGRTLKLFAEGDGSAAREERDAALAKTISEDLRRLGGTDE